MHSEACLGPNPTLIPGTNQLQDSLLKVGEESVDSKECMYKAFVALNRIKSSVHRENENCSARYGPTCGVQGAQRA